MDKALKVFKDMSFWVLGEVAFALCVWVICLAIIKIMPETTDAWQIANFMSPIARRLFIAGGCVCFASFGIYLLLIVVDETTK